ncbi:MULTISPECIES: GNAT family N-acetyltransferase [Vibrio]|uniref:GNAT family N-acetyltransferase n=1 Tax=Vibrio TaxID=662 RepID=UPI003D0F7A4A
MASRDIQIRPAQAGELPCIYDLVTTDEEWTKFNGPYFPYQTPTLSEFSAGTFSRLCRGDDMQLIVMDGTPIGSVSYYWECEATRWLEIGVIIYNSQYWGKGIAYHAVPFWISHLFATLPIERVGLTTWSGNPRMMACAEKLGLTQEARLRYVRYFNGKYYDSVKYGITRQEWSTITKKKSR